MADPFFSEIKYLGSATDDFIEVAVDIGADVSDLVVTVYRDDGTIRSSNDLSVLTPTTVNGKDVYLIEAGDATNFNGIAASQAVSLSENGTVFSFVSFDNTAGVVTATEGPADGMTSTDVGIAGSGSSLETTDGGTTYSTQDTPTPGTVTCLTAGTNISTETGLVKVEDLKEGMQIQTYKGEYETLRKIFTRDITKDELERYENLYPVRICAGALGIGLPLQDMLVSRQHRMLVSSAIAERMFGTSDVLIAATKLTSLPGIFVDSSVTHVTYFHLLFDNHEVIIADGAPTESFLLGTQAIRSLPAESIEEVRTIFPSLCPSLDGFTSEHHIPDSRRQSQLIYRHLKNQRCLVPASV